MRRKRIIMILRLVSLCILIVTTANFKSMDMTMLQTSGQVTGTYFVIVTLTHLTSSPFSWFLALVGTFPFPMCIPFHVHLQQSRATVG